MIPPVPVETLFLDVITTWAAAGRFLAAVKDQQ
jgi:hypothetical protein